MNEGDNSVEKVALQNKLLKLISPDSRISMHELADELNLTKTSMPLFFDDLVNEYGVKFVPEINLSSVWKLEFITHARMQTKRGMLRETPEAFQTMGFEEYLIFVRFPGKKPKDADIMNALHNGYNVQFSASLKNQYDLMLYAVARNLDEINYFARKFSTALSKYKAELYIDRISNTYGFFPVNSSLIGQFSIFDTYKNLLIGINENGRENFSKIGERFKQQSAQVLYAYDRLRRNDILKRVTYYEEKPKNKISKLLIIKINNESEFEKSKDKWFEEAVKTEENKHSAYTFMCDISSPRGMVAILSFESEAEARKTANRIRSMLKGAEINDISLGATLTGHMGIRDFDMRYSSIYAYLAGRGIVKRFDAHAADIQVTENPEL